MQLEIKAGKRVLHNSVQHPLCFSILKAFAAQCDEKCRKTMKTIDKCVIIEVIFI